jgi:chromosome segregation protein
MTLKHIKEQVQERYMVDLESVADRFYEKVVSEEDKQNCISLKEKVARMGEVNLTAIQEFDDLNQRYQTLEVQKQDLLQSLESLKKTIEKINRITKQRFEETFDIVNKNFKRVFPVLFNGGEAQLVLTDQNDLLESGVDIMAKPPGKKLQNMNLLSGGEKALTAISLIFAIFLMKPSPFCLLDEVDAPLDDANVERFNEMVQKMISHSQFIVITHNKKAMAKADILYGITMEHPGISSIISVKLEKAVQLIQPLKKSSLQKDCRIIFVRMR